MQSQLKVFLLRLARFIGAFRIARMLTRSELRILCYHGLSTFDEHIWRPVVFMRQETLQARFRRLRELGYPILPLEDALQRLKAGNIPPAAVVITFDDGFHSVLTHGLPVFKEEGFPVTLYVTTYYMDHPTPIFRLAMQYAVWKARSQGRETPSNDTLWQEIVAGENLDSETERIAVAKAFFSRLGLDWQSLAESRFLTLMTEDELRELDASGVDLELHTHRHRLPLTREGVSREISQNREILEQVTGRRPHHFCYPSGVWSPHHLPFLSELGIQSATTCDAGLNPKSHDALTLRRFLDSESINMVEFEAEVSGFKEICRRVLLRRQDSGTSAERDT